MINSNEFHDFALVLRLIGYMYEYSQIWAHQSNKNITILINLIMDEIYLTPRFYCPSQPLDRLFLRICNDQRIFLILFQYIGFPGYVELSATNSLVSQAIGRHEEVQVVVLRLKVKKLQQREYKRRLSIHLRVDISLYNPYDLPAYDQAQQEQHVKDIEEIEKQKAIAEARKLGNTDIPAQRDWKKWKTTKKISQLFGARETRETMKRQQKVEVAEPAKQPQISYQEKVQSIEKARRIVESYRMIKEKLVEEFPQTENQYEAMRNKHFISKFMDEEQFKSFKRRKVQHRQSHTQPKPMSPRSMSKQFDAQFYDAWDDKLKKQAAKKLWKSSQQSDKEWVPIPKIANNIGSFLQIPAIMTSVKKSLVRYFSEEEYRR